MLNGVKHLLRFAYHILVYSRRSFAIAQDDKEENVYSLILIPIAPKFL
jgi:hypothetical protein